ADAVQDRLRPAHRVGPGDLAAAAPAGVAVEQVLERLAVRPDADDVQAEAPAAAQGLRGDHLEGDGEGAVDAAGAVAVPAGGHLAVQAVAALGVAEGGEELARQLVAGRRQGDELRRLAVELVDARVAPLAE